MKKLLLLCGMVASLAACDSDNSVNLEKLCLDSAKLDGQEITAEVQAFCKCAAEKTIAEFGAEKSAQFAAMMDAAIRQDAAKAQELADPSLEPVFEGYLAASVMCAAEHGMFNE